MNLELTKTYRLRNGTIGLVEELLGDGTFYGTVTAPPTDLRVRVIWDKDGLSTKRGTAWDLVEEVAVEADDEPAGEPFAFGMPVSQKQREFQRNFIDAETVGRIASALERIADHLENMREV